MTDTKRYCIIDGKNAKGKRTSVSMDKNLFKLLIIKMESKKKARKWVRDLMKTKDVVSSAGIRFELYDQIADKKILEIWRYFKEF